MRTTKNPGKNLFEWLQRHFRIRGAEPSGWVKKVAEEMSYEGLDEFLRMATLKMILRRLIATRELYEREKRGGGDPANAFLKDFIRPTFAIGETECSRLSNLVEEAHLAYHSEIPPSLKRKAREEVRQRGACCAICGEKLRAERDGSTKKQSSTTRKEPRESCATPSDGWDYVTLDHIWPRALGGPAIKENLRFACQRCNSLRKDMIGLCDTDFQLFHVRVPSGDDSYSKEFSRKYRMAVADDFNQMCEVCHLPVTAPRSPVNFKQIRRDEALGTFNIQLVCDRHGRRGLDT
jgi:5-methylcytosine-specific restriction endonuclease McrA